MREPEVDEFMKELAGIRKRNKLTQKDVAKRMGVAQNSVARMETGSHNVQIGTVLKYAEAVGAFLEIRTEPWG